ncbi:MAG: AI-2E family transporter, partial [Eubacteriales bacterium]|nr:AI-2E family transporter [Eubacteriales bacterium]
PELIRSITNLVYSFPHYVNVVQKWLDSIIARGWNLDADAIDMVEAYSLEAQNYLTTTLLPQLQGMLKNISSGLFDVFIFLKNFIIGAIVSVYILADKEGFVAKGKMIAYAMFPTERANFVIHAMRFTSQTFIGFISGKILDSAIIGVLCYIGISLMNMPYVILVSVVVGVTNVIPFFGPYLGAIPCIILILLVDPLKALYFALFILALQQFDGNILGPMILGESTGLSSFMVIVAILVGGGVFGIPGMIIGVPVFAVFYAAFRKLIRLILAGKDIPNDEEVYRDMDCLDSVTKERIPMPKEERHKEDKRAKRTMLLEFLMTILVSLRKVGILLWRYLRRGWSFLQGKVGEWYGLYQKKREEKKEKERS